MLNTLQPETESPQPSLPGPISWSLEVMTVLCVEWSSSDHTCGVWLTLSAKRGTSTQAPPPWRVSPRHTQSPALRSFQNGVPLNPQLRTQGARDWAINTNKLVRPAEDWEL